MRTCFAQLIDTLHQQTEPDHTLLYEYHRKRIADLFATQPDLPLDQDSLAGFLYGILTAELHLIPAGSIERQTMFAAIGGTALLARTLPITPGTVTAGRGFINRLALALPAGEFPACTDNAADPAALITEAFSNADDVPITCATLGGFCLGLLYATPWLPDHTAALTLLTTACQHALHLG